MPSGFGAYFPDGDYVGYRERLTKYFDEEMPAEEKAKFGEDKDIGYVSHVVQNFTYEPGTAHGDNIPCRLVAEYEWPEEYELVKTYKALGSLFEMNGQLLAVEPAFKDVVERLEPGIHHFRPLRVTTRKREAYPKRYYTMVISKFLDCFDPASSAEGSWEKPSEDYDSYRVYIDTKKYMEGLAFSRSAIGNAHLWRERRLYSPQIYFSDALKAAFDRAGLRLPRHYRMKEV
ncbi:imm11 family protein [Labrenzia sp. MBR-25]